MIEGKPYCHLVEDLKLELGLKVDVKAPPKKGGLSIEGLSATRRPGELIIAFRSPLIQEKALLVLLRNADALIEGDGPRFGDPILLDLGGLGVRSLDYWPERNAYLVLAGPSGDNGKKFQLMWWSGQVSEPPVKIDGLRFEDIGIDGAPEAVLTEPGGSAYILFDEGNRKVDGDKCKDSKEKGFHSVCIRDL